MNQKTALFQRRWQAEARLMRNTFPEFEPFVREGLLTDVIGFEGQLKGKSGRIYTVRIRARTSGYPASAPKIYIRPWVGPNWYPDGSLCVNRPWRPQQDTFAQQVLYAAHYLQQHG
jgi:ubiquitin-protein ligase